MDTLLEHASEVLPATQTHRHLEAHHGAKLPQSSLTPVHDIWELCLQIKNKAYAVEKKKKNL